MLLEEIQKMVEALVKNDSKTASEHFKNYSSAKIRDILGEKKSDDDDDKDDDKDSDDDDDDDDEKDEKDEKKGKKKFPFEKKSKKDDDDEKNDVKENLAVKGGPVDSKEKEYASYRHNEKGEAYHKVPHKDDSKGYGHEKSKAASRNLSAKSDSGASEKKKDAYNDTVHKDNSESADSKKFSRSGLKNVEKSTTSPDSDGKKENRRTDKTAKYHGTDRGGKEV